VPEQRIGLVAQQLPHVNAHVTLLWPRCPDLVGC